MLLSPYFADDVDAAFFLRFHFLFFDFHFLDYFFDAASCFLRCFSAALLMLLSFRQRLLFAMLCRRFSLLMRFRFRQLMIFADACLRS